MSKTTDVLVIGAGPTGLFLAYLLASQRIGVQIIDVSPHRALESRAIAIQARTLELFQTVDLAGRFIKAGLRGQGLSVYIEGQAITQLNFSDIGRTDTPFPYILFLSQSITEEILEQALIERGVKIQRKTALLQYHSSETGIEAQLKNEHGQIETVSAHYLIGCDGAKSQVRKSLNLTFKGGTYLADFLLADAKLDWSLPNDRLLLFLGKKDTTMIMPIKGSDRSRVMTVGESPFTSVAEQSLTTQLPTTPTEVEAVLQNASAQSVHLSKVAWVSRYRVHHRSVESMRADRVFLAGDAAHIHSPAGGQGMNTGLQDAANLAFKLAMVIQGSANEALLATYQSERLPIAKKLLHFTDRLFRMATSQSRIVKKIRHFVLPIIAPPLFARARFRRYLFGFISQLNIRYHDSLIVQPVMSTLRRHPLKPGMRAPDATLKSGSTLFQCLKGYQFNLLVLSRKPISNEDKAAFQVDWLAHPKIGSDQAPIHWIDGSESEEAMMRYAVGEVLVLLIRPDGYISYMQTTLNHPVK